MATNHSPTASADRLARLAARIETSITAAGHDWWVDKRDALAIELYEAQRAAVPAYDAWCAHELASRRARGGSGSVERLVDVPALPVSAFKQLEVAAAGLAPVACWSSSGTSRSDQPSRHALPDLGAYEAAIDAGTSLALVPDVAAGDREPLHCIQLQPAAADAPTSSLTHMFDRIRTGPWCRDAGTYVDGRYRLDVAGVRRALEACVEAREAVLVLATSFALAMLLDDAESHGWNAQLPAGSRVVDTGGFKGRTRELSRDELVARVGDVLGVDHGWCENEYGMSELSSQGWLGTVAGSCGHPLQGAVGDAAGHWSPPWLVVRVVDPHTLDEVEPGERGLLVMHDLANCWTAAAIRTEDVGVRLPDGRVHLLGRANGAELKGCSLNLEQVHELAPFREG